MVGGMRTSHIRRVSQPFPLPRKEHRWSIPNASSLKPPQGRVACPPAMCVSSVQQPYPCHGDALVPRESGTGDEACDGGRICDGRRSRYGPGGTV